jgi:type IV secretion system protein VirB5
MRKSRLGLLVLTGCVSNAFAPSAHAQLAVIDAPAVAQLVQQVQQIEQAIATAKSQLLQAEQQLQAMRGDRGMENLQSGINRVYLPSDWSQLAGAAQGNGGAYAGLAANSQGLVGVNAVLTPQQLAAMSPTDRQQIVAARQWTAMTQAVSQAALANSNGRFATMQSLINAIPTASDLKGILDLQARIAAELGMLQIEQTKLQVLAQSLQAQEAAGLQQQRELGIAGQGSFATRFQPVP